MIQLVIALTLLTASQDTVSNTGLIEMQRKCGRQVLINSIAGFTCVIGTGIFYARGGNAYDEYKSSVSMKEAAEAWDRVKLNDTMRNVLAVGSVIFLTRAIYYQLKRVRLQRSSALTPILEVRYAAQPKLLVGLSRSL